MPANLVVAGNLMLIPKSQELVCASRQVSRLHFFGGESPRVQIDVYLVPGATVQNALDSDRPRHADLDDRLCVYTYSVKFAKESKVGAALVAFVGRADRPNIEKLFAELNSCPMDAPGGVPQLIRDTFEAVYLV